MANLREYLDITERSHYKHDFENFKDNIFKHTLHWEGGGKLHKVKHDSGGWTIWGIAFNHNKGIFKDLADFKDTTYSEAAAIAFSKYFLLSKANLVPDNCKLMYFDIAYNMGVKRAIKIMQRCVGVKADGLIGPVTLKHISKLTPECMYQRRVGFYNYLVRKNSKFKKFIKGWLNRAKDIFEKSNMII